MVVDGIRDQTALENVVASFLNSLIRLAARDIRKVTHLNSGSLVLKAQQLLKNSHEIVNSSRLIESFRSKLGDNRRVSGLTWVLVRDDLRRTFRARCQPSCVSYSGLEVKTSFLQACIVSQVPFLPSASLVQSRFQRTRKSLSELWTLVGYRYQTSASLIRL